MGTDIVRDDFYYMKIAFQQAHKAAQQDEVPIGAIVIDANGVIIGYGYNQVESKAFQGAHAECIAIEQATHTMGDWRLDGCTIYVTLAPCKMCMSLIQLSRLDQVIYAADSPRFGYQLDNTAISSVYKKDVLIKRGMCADEAQHVLKQFFQQRRKKKDGCKKAGSGSNQKRVDGATEHNRTTAPTSFKRKSI